MTAPVGRRRVVATFSDFDRQTTGDVEYKPSQHHPNRTIHDGAIRRDHPLDVSDSKSLAIAIYSIAKRA